MNDEFLQQLRQPPAPEFAARLRARLESQAAARRFRARRISLYAVIASLLGGTAFALVSPSLRSSTAAVLQSLLPQAFKDAAPMRAPVAANAPAREALAPNPAPPLQSMPSADRESTAAVNSSGFVTDADNAAASATVSAPSSRFANAAPVPAMPQSAAVAIRGTRIEGAKVTASVLSLAVKPFEARQARQGQQRRGRIDLRGSSSEQGFDKFCAGEIDIALATRPMSQGEAQICKRSNIWITELPIAYEALVVLVNGGNDWADAVSARDLRMLFVPREPGFTANWNDLQPRWPAAPIALAAPRPGQGFLESFAEMISILPSESANRTDISVERDESGLLQFVLPSINALTYLPLASYLKSDSQGAIKPLKIVNSQGKAVAPSSTSVADGSYEPLSRPLLIYVNLSSRTRQSNEEADAFLQFFMTYAGTLLSNSRYLPLESAEYGLAIKILRRKLTGAQAYRDGPVASVTAREMLLQFFTAAEREQERAELERNQRR